MLKDGLYELLYRSDTPAAASDSLLIMLRDGKVLGSDQWGGVLFGECRYDRDTGRHGVNVRLQVPPGGILITDPTPRPEGCIIDIKMTLNDADEGGSGVVDVAGQPVRIELVYKGRGV